MIECIEENDGSLTIKWDENDPVESQMNTWTEQDFIDAIMDKCKELKKEKQDIMRRERAEQVMYAFSQNIMYEEDWDEGNVAAALREAVEGLNIEPDPDKELSAEKHYFIKGQLWVKDAIMRLADELEKMSNGC